MKPAVWRTFRCPADATLRDLHCVLQVVMGWTNSHLHAFEHDGDRYAELGPDFEMDGADIDTDDVTVGELLRKVGDNLSYEYDFGDGWSHTVSLQAIHATAPEVWCIDGKQVCPPDDCGGPMGYANLLGILAKPKHPEHRDMLEWLEPAYPDGFNPEAFDIDAINEQLADGLEGVRADFEDVPDEMDLDEDDDDPGKPSVSTALLIPSQHSASSPPHARHRHRPARCPLGHQCSRHRLSHRRT